MKPIISPLWFYLIGISGGVMGVTTALAALLIFAAIIMVICYGVEQDCSTPNEKLCSFFKRNAKRSFIIGVVCAILATFTPSEKTCYQMMAASIVTPDNIETVINTTKDGVEWLIDTITEASEKLSDNETESVDE